MNNVDVDNIKVTKDEYGNLIPLDAEDCTLTVEQLNTMCPFISPDINESCEPLIHDEYGEC